MTAGVGAGGLLELRAQVYRTQEHARMVREGDAERPVRRKVLLCSCTQSLHASCTQQQSATSALDVTW